MGYKAIKTRLRLDKNQKTFLLLLMRASKNLYNEALYNVRQHFFETKKYLSYVDNFHVSKSQESYKLLPAKVSNQTLKLIDFNFKSFFALSNKAK